MKKAQVKQVIIELAKEVEKKRKMVLRGLITDIDAYHDLKGMIDGIKLTLDIFFPHDVFIEISILNGIVNDLFMGTKEQQQLGKDSLTLALSMLEA